MVSIRRVWRQPQGAHTESRGGSNDRADVQRILNPFRIDTEQRRTVEYLCLVPFGPDGDRKNALGGVEVGHSGKNAFGTGIRRACGGGAKPAVARLFPFAIAGRRHDGTDERRMMGEEIPHRFGAFDHEGAVGFPNMFIPDEISNVRGLRAGQWRVGVGHPMSP